MRHNPTEVNLLNTEINGNPVFIDSILDNGKNIAKLAMPMHDFKAFAIEMNKCKSSTNIIQIWKYFWNLSTKDSIYGKLLLCLPKLRHLALPGPLVGESGMNILPSPTRDFAATLTTLDLSFNRFTHSFFSEIKHFKNLRTLILFNVHFLECHQSKKGQAIHALKHLQNLK